MQCGLRTFDEKKNLFSKDSIYIKESHLEVSASSLYN